MSRKEKVDVSVIVLTYNHEKYIAKALESILCQKTTYKYEILVGDDVSADRTRQIVDCYQKKYPEIIRTFYHRRNLGATKNAYTLLKHARGNYFAFCEGDDYWTDEYRMQRDIHFLWEREEYAGVCGRVSLVDEQGKALEKDTIPTGKQFWSFAGEYFDVGDFEKWNMPGQLSALTIRNFMKDSGHDHRILYRAHRMVGDRTIVLLTTLRGKIFCNSYLTGCYRYRIDGEENFMSEFERKNLYAEDYLMLRRLEYYAEREFGTIIHLDKVKKDRLAAAVVRAMKSKKVSDMQAVLKILYYSAHPARYLYYINKIIVLKNIYWHIANEDRRIKL